MYFQSLVSEDSRLLQGAARIRGGDARRFGPVFGSMLAGWTAMGIASLSMRHMLDDDGAVETLLVLTSPEDRAPELRRLFARLALLDGVAGVQVDLLATDSELEAARAAWPDPTIAFDAGLQTAAGARLLCRAVWPDLMPSVITRMHSLGARLWWQVNMAPATPPAGLQKEWGRSLVALDGVAAPAALRAYQQAEFVAARQATVNMETFWATPPDMVATLIASLDQVVCASVPALGGATLHTRLSARPDPVIEMLHSAILSDPDPDAAAGAVGYASQVEASAALALPKGLRSTHHPIAGGGDRSGVADRSRPPVNGSGTYSFVSYAHADAHPVYEILRRMAGGGIPYWYDRGIPAGEDWNEELEARLAECSSVLAFLSPRAAQSRYCRREIQYADLLGKRIVPVVLEPTRLVGGLSFILAPIQHTEASDPELIERLRASLSAARP